jgi:trigger factor
MDLSLTTTSGLERRLEVSLPGERVAAEVDQRLRQLARSVRIKGFRAGKVPYAVVKTQYAGQVHAEAVQELMQSSFAEAVTAKQLRPAASPRIEPITVAPGGELRFAAIFEVLPEIRIQPLDSLRVERPTATVGTTDVDEMLERMRQQKPEFSVVERAARASDRVTIDFEGRIAGEVFPGGKGEGMKVTLGTGGILAELDAALHGMAVGESKTVATRFPDDYGAKVVAGKQAEFDLKVTAVEEQKLPELDDNFARAVGLPTGGISELRVEIQKGMERELAESTRIKMRDQLLDALYKANPLEVPRVLIDEQVRELQVQMLRRMGVQKLEQMPPREPYEEPARKRVALGLIIGEIVRAQSFKLDRERVEARLTAAVAGSEDPENLRRQYLQSREAMQQIESAALEDQALDWALSQAKITDKPSSFRELTGYGQSAGSPA